VADMTDAEQQEIQRITETVDAEVAAIADDDIDSYLTLLSEDALFLPPGLPSIGGEELHTWLREFLEQWRIEWLAYNHNETEAGAVFAFHRFSYSWRLEPKGGGELRVSHGKGLHILRRSADDSWKIARKVWNDRPTPNTL
jgi:ketosteroid isomerase-like protein